MSNILLNKSPIGSHQPLRIYHQVQAKTRREVDHFLLAAHIKIPRPALMYTGEAKSIVLQDLVLEAGVVLRDEVLRVKLLAVLFVQLAHLLEVRNDGAESAKNDRGQSQ